MSRWKEQAMVECPAVYLEGDQLLAKLGQEAPAKHHCQLFDLQGEMERGRQRAKQKDANIGRKGAPGAKRVTMSVLPHHMGSVSHIPNT